MSLRPLALLASACLVAACGPREPELEVKPVRIAGSVQPVAPGDCAEARRRAHAEPALVVDRLPTPIAMRPKPLRNVPASALRRDGSADIKVRVLIDTLGRPDMRTFKVDAASHPWFVDNIRSVLPKWKFSPAQLAGCKVPRIYQFMASAPARRTPAAARAAQGS